MLLTRTMTLEADLPDAPAGCEWRLVTSDHGQVALYRGDSGLGLLTGIGQRFAEFGVMAEHIFLPHNQTRRSIGVFAEEREAASSLLASLGY